MIPPEGCQGLKGLRFSEERGLDRPELSLFQISELKSRPLA